MKMECRQVGTVEVCTPVGPLVDEDADQFSAKILQQLRSPNSRAVVALSEVPYMDSAALEGLLDAADELSDRGARLKLVGVTATCREVMELTGLSDRFQFFEELEDAVKSFL